jgi:RNA polymerase sigma factor (sigma-70 family)
MLRVGSSARPRMATSHLPSPRQIRLSDPALRRAVEAAVRRRVRGDEADDVVQATYADVLASPKLPEGDEDFRRFVFGVARNKVFDHFRRQRRSPEELSDEHEGGEQPLSARDILRWAEGELPDSEAHDTLQWMLREGDGEKLEHIARDARVPAPRVRKRVSRLRKLLRERWAAELTLAGLLLALLLLGAFAYYAAGHAPNDIVKGEPPRPAPSVPRAPAPLPRSEDRGPAPSLPAGDPLKAAPAPSITPPAKVLPTSSAAPTPNAKPTPQLQKKTPRPQSTDAAMNEVLGPTQMSPKQNVAPQKSKVDSFDSSLFDGAKK